MSALSELKRLKMRAAKPPTLTEEEKKDPLIAAGYAWGFSDGVSECIQITEEEQGE